MSRRISAANGRLSGASIGALLTVALGSLLMTHFFSINAEDNSHMTQHQHNDAAAPPKFTNRLVDETSPYLLQHAHNPVDWYPWGEEALQKAKAENKPIFLSVGYSACHWCHVMEHESFESEAVAALLNADFVSVKVDREERPDIDEIYMTAVQLMTGSGGWPMTVFMTPDLKPFFGGTYFPPEDRYGRPGFPSLIKQLAKAWKEQHGQITQVSEQLTAAIQESVGGREGGQGPINAGLLATAIQSLKGSYDADDAGFGSAPKFPPSRPIAMLLREHHRSKDADALKIATHTLERMALGGMYDQLGGGFHRYSVDAEWLVPHFEKMLYDNALLCPVYLEAWQVTKDPLFRRMALEILGYVDRDMTDEKGAFYSSEDADSEGEEGKFYLWTHKELESILGKEDAALFVDIYNIEPRGNFSSHEPYHRNLNIPHFQARPNAIAAKLGISEADLWTRIEGMRTRLLAVRNNRVRPGLDDKILVSWNALMISAYAKAYQVLGDERHRDTASKAAQFILSEMRHDGYRLWRTHRRGKSKIDGYLDDYAFLIAALIDLYECDFDATWLSHADGLAKSMIAQFWDEANGGFYFTQANQSDLITRTKPTYDGAIPSGNSVAAGALLRLAKLLNTPDYFNRAETVLKQNSQVMSQSPRGFMEMLLAVDFLVHAPKEIAIVGSPTAAGTQTFFDVLRDQYIPNKIVALLDPGATNQAGLAKQIPLLAGKTLTDNKPTVYVCKDFACQQPVNTASAFRQLIGPSLADLRKPLK